VVRYVESVAATAEMIAGAVPISGGGGETALELAGDVGEAGVGAKLDDHVVLKDPRVLASRIAVAIHGQTAW